MELARFGVPVRIIDKYEKPSNTSRALAVQSRTLELFAGESGDEVRYREALGDAVYVLVRPDGYIACVGAEQGGKEARRWFEAWFEGEGSSA